MKVDLRLYALIDPQRAGDRPLGELARLIAPSATLVQLRDKRGETREMIETARALKAALAPARVPLIINDRVDVALAAQADGVHVGQDDMPVPDARRLLGDTAIIGLSLKAVGQANAAPLEHLSYVAIGGVFATQSKDNPGSPVGLEGFRRILGAVRKRAPRMPVVAIAGIDHGNAADVIAAGADGVAVIAALSLASDPAEAARSMRLLVDGALTKRGAR